MKDIELLHHYEMNSQEHWQMVWKYERKAKDVEKKYNQEIEKLLKEGKISPEVSMLVSGAFKRIAEAYEEYGFAQANHK